MSNGKPADLLKTCSTQPDTLYRLPFGAGPGWSLVRANWDDPGTARHDTVDGAAQSYSYDFAHDDGEGQEIRAARGGRVEFVNNTQSDNTLDMTPDSPGARGEGNLVVIRHLDAAVSTYAHLQRGKVHVEAGEYVPRGRVIGLYGNTGSSRGPHLHFDAHPSFTDWDNWVPTMRIRFEAKKRSCWRPNVGDTLESNNKVSDLSFSALFGPSDGIGSGDQSFLAGMNFAEFVAAWDVLGKTGKFPRQDMKYFDTYFEGGERRFAGLFGPGKGGQGFLAGLTSKKFMDTRTDLAKKKADMLAFDTYLEGGKRRFAGLFGPGKGGQTFFTGLEFDLFVKTWAELGKKKIDMLDFRVYPEGGKTRCAGLFGPGKGGQAFLPALGFDSFVKTWAELGKKKLDMLTFQVYRDGGKTRFAGLFGPGKGKQAFLAGVSFDDVASKWAIDKKQGGRLISVVVGHSGD